MVTTAVIAKLVVLFRTLAQLAIFSVGNSVVEIQTPNYIAFRDMDLRQVRICLSDRQTESYANEPPWMLHRWAQKPHSTCSDKSTHKT